MPIPDISLSQFNKIATGDYNAGLVDFKTDDHGNLTGELTKVNNHVHKKSLNNVVLSRITSCCAFSSSVAGSNFATSSCRLKGLFFGGMLGLYSLISSQPPQSKSIRGSTSLYTRSLSSVAVTISVARKIVVPMIMG